MKKILIIFAHPRFEHSRSNASLVHRIPSNGLVTFNDLYERYPDFNIDVGREKALLDEHRVVVWHHPFYWYGAPPLMKQWIDMVLEFGWAYGPGGMALKDKIALNVITSGGARDAYSHEGRNRFTIREFLLPFEQTARLCHMTYLPPFAVQGTHRIDDEQLGQIADDYAELLARITSGNFDVDALSSYEFLNDWIAATRGETS
jgi:glutathione-regulated potassium-efflux system ancillary protein KefG